MKFAIPEGNSGPRACRLYYLLCMGEYTYKQSRNDSKQTVPFGLINVIFSSEVGRAYCVNYQETRARGYYGG